MLTPDRNAAAGSVATGPTGGISAAGIDPSMCPMVRTQVWKASTPALVRRSG